MHTQALLVFMATLFVAAVAPGPGVAAIVARVLSRGPGGAVAFVAGIASADLVWLTLGVLGLAVVAKTFTVLFLVIRFVGAAYLLYLAWRMWNAPAELQAAPALPGGTDRLRLYATGFSVNMGNPKVIVFYLALLPNLVDLSAVTTLAYLELIVATATVLALVFGSYVLLATRARRLFETPRAVRLLNRSSGVVMAGAAVAIATR
ncbi:Threonine/homoserine/homoserine lactone efflux protein [Faunimonas pinastri]|uniref:Threonine/homoserine/homoserine lactone efflux protein n=1 Tax=Faunimonas pinastri TaxID=1855383 RepID=A0A1H9HQQ6_9HYPH|nr:LysE family translocator [Faunimonas pinastri]SEQ64674.1 Threonine/homoserine/homoserine lactone efflux protein [Faunimonas pinastri]